MWRRTSFVASLAVCLVALFQVAYAVKFELPASKHPKPLCIWNYALADTLGIISVNDSHLDVLLVGCLGDTRHDVDRNNT